MPLSNDEIKNMMKDNPNSPKCGCGESASFFHSRCCNAHFEGRIEGNKYMIVCEKCGKFVAEIKT